MPCVPARHDPAMLTTLAIDNYRSLRDLVVPLDRLNVVTGANGSGKSNLYRALRLLAETAEGGLIRALAREGGLAVHAVGGAGIGVARGETRRACGRGHAAQGPGGAAAGLCRR